jgi:hypothetical protein
MRTSQGRSLYFIERLLAAIQANISGVQHFASVRATQRLRAHHAKRMSSDNESHMCAWGIRYHDRQ